MGVRGNCPPPKIWVAEKLLKHIRPFGAEKPLWGNLVAKLKVNLSICNYSCRKFAVSVKKSQLSAVLVRLPFLPTTLLLEGFTGGKALKPVAVLARNIWGHGPPPDGERGSL